MLEGFSEMGSTGKMELIFVFIACAVQIVMFARDMRLRIQASAFCEQIRKLVAAGNPERAMKLCAAAPASPLAFLVKIGLEANKSKQSARDAMTAAYPRVLSAARGPLLFALVAGALAVGVGAVLVAEDGFAYIVTVPLGVAGILGALTAMRFVAWPRELALAYDALG